jgi:tight adherence protein B
MEPATYAILLAVTVALAAWGAAQFFVRWCGDRKSVIQRRLASNAVAGASSRSVTLQLENPLPSVLRGLGALRSLQRALTAAYPDVRFGRFLGLLGALAGLGFLMLYAIMDSPLAGLVGAAGATYLPLWVINGKRAKRQRALSNQLPEGLDFLARVLRAGHSFSTGLQMMGDELHEPLAGEFRRAYAQHSLGQALEDALRDMARRIESTDFAFFVTAVLIQRQTGGDLSEVLTNISAMVRQRIRLQQHVKAITAEGRLTSYVLVAFPVVLFFISYALNPDYAGVLLRTGTGQMLLGVAAALVFFGLMIIRRIVTVRT